MQCYFFILDVIMALTPPPPPVHFWLNPSASPVCVEVINGWSVTDISAAVL